MDKQWGIIELLNYSRHDWLNKMQLIKGNIELNNLDYVKAIINNVIVEAKNEAQLANMQMPKTAECLMTCNWRDFVFSLEYEVLQVNNSCHKPDQVVSKWISAFMDTLNVTLDPFGENELKIVIDESVNSLRFTFDLVGKIKDNRILDVFLKECPSLATMCVNSFTDEELVFVVEWELQTL
ncbi:Spo0B C-terminal domain-containing protein [Bacillus massiliigorillae]|uniref:Spo0B C-terminal domain-containing protein n=1 Tax=Bacillus massiliigorillae TaxID=1243664 RepID=UPI000399CF27|nr:Spo0B C-terminal domain-containing protein [Bacillus massiliigorillae]